MRTASASITLAVAQIAAMQPLDFAHFAVGEKTRAILQLNETETPVSILKPGWEMRNGDESPLEVFGPLKQPIIVYVPSTFLPRWQQFPKDLLALASCRTHTIIAFFYPASGSDDVAAWRWILSALLCILEPARYQVELEFVPARGPAFICALPTPRRLAGYLLRGFRWALSINESAGVKGDPKRVSGLVISIKPRCGR